MRTLLLPLLLACNSDPGEIAQTVDYRTGEDGGATSGERGTVILNEILWSGSVTNDGVHDVTDVYVEFRNEGNRAVDLTGWHLILDGAIEKTWRIPEGGPRIPVGGQAFAAAKSSGCFPDADWVIPGLKFPQNAPFRLTLRDADERLIEPAGSTEMLPYAGGYDFVSSYAMERISLMFGARGTEPQAWHFYNRSACPTELTEGAENASLFCFEGIPNNTRVAPTCRVHTLGSPGLANSPDYSGATAAGGFE